MKKIYLALAVLTFVSCKFNQNGNKNILPARDGHQVQTTTTTTTQVNESTANVATDSVAASSAQVDASGNYFYNVGNLQDITLPNGTVLNVGANSTENKLFNMLSDAGFAVSEDKTQGWVTLDRVYFETGSDQLTANSTKQVENIVAILKAFPEANVKLGGYTDNTGSQQINLPLSDGRAKSVMQSISGAGVDATRLTAEGYGAQHPVCPANDTDMCKAQNRRVDIRITQK